MGGISAALLLSACAGGAGPNDLGYDPHVAQNRPVHETNMAIDKAVYGPVARAYGATVPAPVRHGITNLNDNWGLPGEVIQYGLQGNGMRAAEAGTRFLVNTLFGLGGLIEVRCDTAAVPPRRRSSTSSRCCSARRRSPASARALRRAWPRRFGGRR